MFGLGLEPRRRVGRDIMVFGSEREKQTQEQKIKTWWNRGGFGGLGVYTGMITEVFSLRIN
jgi:hypothetical protein